ncbi:MAG: glucokinase [Candidatus Methylomirabilis sp.]
MILAGDIGGTKTLLALYEGSRGALSQVREEAFQSGDALSLEEILQRFLRPGSPALLQAACFAVAGPVIDGKCKTTNLPWELDEAQLGEALHTRVRLLNDLEGAAYGLLSLGPDEIEVLQPAVKRQGNVALIAAGTGLGEAILVRAGERHQVIASEGGHADFAPRSDLETALLGYLRQEYGHVSYERLLSGPGLHNIYRFLRDTGYAPEPAWLKERLATADPSAVISEAALSAGDPLCAAALDLFVSIYGAEAGNLALKSLALGGVFVGGGIAPKILPKLRDGSFVKAFCDKGRMAGLMRSLEVSVVLNPRMALIGAATVACELSAARVRPTSAASRRRSWRKRGRTP